jgi:hypothetical protein
MSVLSSDHQSRISFPFNNLCFYANHLKCMQKISHNKRQIKLYFGLEHILCPGFVEEYQNAYVSTQ